MYWTKEKPVKDGFYWVLDVRPSLKNTPQVVFVESGCAWFSLTDSCLNLNDMVHALWYGPLTPPPRESSES